MELLEGRDIDAALCRPWNSLSLTPRFEAGFSVWHAESHRLENRFYLTVVLALTLMFLALDYHACQFGLGLLVRFGLQVPALLTGITLLNRQHTPIIAAFALVVPTVVLLVSSVFLGLMSSGDSSELYLMSAGISCLSLNLAYRLRLRHGVALCLCFIPVYMGLPISGLFGAQPITTVSMVVMLGLLVTASLIPIARRERSEQDLYLLNLRGDVQSRELRRLVAELSRLSTIDALTQIGNRRYFDETFDRLWTEAVRDGTRLALALVDIDHFKSLNDTAGHAEGDRCLNAVAQAIATRAKMGQDLPARYGGEEFAILLPLTGDPSWDDREANALGERARSAVEGLGIPHPSRPSGDMVTVSVGVAVASPGVDLGLRASLMETADLALYRSKRTGRNRVTVADAQPSLHHSPTAAIA